MSFKFGSLKDGLKRARKEKGLTQADFAKAFKIGNTPVVLTTVRNWEQGRTYPEARTLEALCDFYQCDMDYLFGRIDCKTHDLQFISDYTGLDEAAITNLQQLKENGQGQITSVLNHLICNKAVLEKLTVYYASKFEPITGRYPYCYFKGHPAEIDERLFYADVLSVLPVDRENFYNENLANSNIAEQMAFALLNQGMEDYDFIALLRRTLNDIVKFGSDSQESGFDPPEIERLDGFYDALVKFGKIRGYSGSLETMYSVATKKYNDRLKSDGIIGMDIFKDDDSPF